MEISLFWFLVILIIFGHFWAFLDQFGSFIRLMQLSSSSNLYIKFIFRF